MIKTSGLVDRAPAVLTCWLGRGLLQSSAKQHSILAPELLLCAFLQKSMYEHDFITVSERNRDADADSESDLNNPTAEADKGQEMHRSLQ